MGVHLRRKKLQGGRQSLYLDIYQEGRKRQYEFLKIYLKKGSTDANRESLKLAEQIRANRELELQSAAHGLVPNFKRRADLIKYFEKIGKEKEASGLYSSETAWWNTFKHLKAFTGGKIQFAAVDPHFLEKFQQYLLSHVSANTASNYFAKLKNCLELAVKDRILLENPAKRVSAIKRTEIEKIYLTIGEIRQLAKTIPENQTSKEVARAFLFSCFTGLRVSDARKLTFGNLEDGCLKFRQQKTKGFEYLPLNKTALSLIGETLQPDSKPVFKFPSLTYCNRALKLWGAEAGIKKQMHYHLSRHTFAVLTLSSGTDLYTTSVLLGHKQLSTTEVYAQVVGESKRRAVEAMPELEL